MSSRPSELDGTDELADAAALAEAVHALTAACPDGVFFEDFFDQETAALLGVTTTEPVAEVVTTVPGHRFAVFHSYTWSLLAHAENEMRFADGRDEIGDHEGAARARKVAVLACRDARRGELSEELKVRQGDGSGDGIPLVSMISDEEYDARCRAAGNVELADAFTTEFRAVRPHGNGGHRPLVIRRSPRRARPRERRSASRRTAGSSPARPAGDDGEADPPLALGATA
jgi:hypothetical protein